MSKKIFLSKTARAAILIVAGAVGEWLVYTLFMADWDVMSAFVFFRLTVIHALSVLVFSLGVYDASGLYSIGSSKNWILITAVICFVFPVIGVVFMCYLFVGMAKKLWNRNVSLDDYERYITYDYKPEEKHIDEEKMVETVSDELLVQPLVDVMREDDMKLRRGAVNLMRKLPKKDAVSLLKLSLSDKNVEIRFYAAVGLSEVENEINTNIETSKRELERKPDSVEARLGLANSYKEYYECGILDDETSGFYLDLAIDEYHRICRSGGEDIHILNVLGNLEAARKNYGEALSKFEAARGLDPDNVFANVGMMQIYYETGRIKETGEVARRIITKMPETKGPMRKLVEYWATT